jgi:hypothetical protein
MTPRRVVTLPPSERGERAVAFARRARENRADLLEIRSDLHSPQDVPVARLREEIPLLASERGEILNGDWISAAALVDRPLGAPGATRSTLLLSLHAGAPLTPDEALAKWNAAASFPDAQIKHVEPLGPPAEAHRLIETQKRLADRFGSERITVLATGACSLPFRCVLAERNALDYLALDDQWSAASGQRLLADALRDRHSGPRRGILGTRIAHSRSPRIHPPPFDRIDLPADAPIGELLDALRPHYAGLAITAPFKKAAADHVQAPLPAVNTLARRRRGWDAINTDIEGALELLRRLGDGPVVALGDGGATAALRIAAANVRRPVEVLQRRDAGRAVRGLVVWTWPEQVDSPPGLRFEDARVAVIAYGSPGRRVADRIKQLGGVPVHLGAAWFVAQARAQRRFWESAE